MELESINIKNFRSIRDSGTINIKNNPLIIVGKNNSGKSNLFKCIKFFIDNLVMNNSEAENMFIDDFFEKKSSNTIEICCSFKIEEKEFNKIFKTFDVKNIFSYFKEIPKIVLTLNCSELSNGLIKKGIKSLCLNNKEILSKPYNFLNIINLNNQRLEGDMHFSGENELIKNIIKEIKDSVIFIPSIRYIVNEDLMKPVIENTLIQGTSIKRFLNDIKNDKDLDSKYNAIVDEFKIFEEFDKLYSNRTKSSLEIYSGKYKIETQGDGFSQSLIILSYLISMQNHIFLIEEPEAHLHNFLQRKFIEILNKYIENNQIFITTHSPIFCSAFNTENVIIAKKINSETKFLNYKNDDELINNIYSELGIQLSDFFVADNICFVEGINDEKVFNKLLKLFGYGSNTIKFVNSETWTKLKLHANLKALDKKIDCWFIFDGDTNYLKKEKKDAINEIGANGFSKNIFTLKKLDLESYFLIPKIINSFKKNGFKINLSIEKIQEIIEDNKAKKGKKIFEKIFEESDFKSYHDDYVDIVESLNNLKDSIIDIKDLQEIFEKILSSKK